MSRSDPFAVLVTPPPTLTERQVSDVLAVHYGLSGQLTPLVSERDQNFRLETAAGERFVVKIANSAEDPAVTEFQTAALAHIRSADPGCPVPAVVATSSGVASARLINGEREHTLRVLSWQGGVPLSAARDARAGKSLGATLGRLDKALGGYSHPAKDYVLLWDITHAASLAGQLRYVGDDQLRERCRRQLGYFAKTVRPALDDLRWQVIHNDFNPGNVLVDTGQSDRVVGIIDFGDVVHAPLIVDVAVAASYLCTADTDPFDQVDGLLQTYTREVPLQVAELELLFDLVLVRAIISVIISNWRVRHFPENADYIMVDEARTSARLRALTAYGGGEATDRFKRLAGLT